MPRSSNLKLLVIGLDGATFDVIRPMLARGELPNLSALIKNGVSGRLESTTPPFSAPAWSSFMTGMNPGGHGIFGFVNYNPLSYSHIDSKLVTAVSLAGHTLFDILGRAGHRLAAITVPITYPAWAVNGFMIAGEPCPDTDTKTTYPEDLAAKLPRRYAFHSTFWARPNDAIIAGIHEMDESRASLAIRLIEEEHLDAMVVVLGATDRAQHNFWRYYDAEFGARLGLPKEADYEDVIPETYRKADASVGRILSCADENTLILVISDHGGGAAGTRAFHTNAWLEQLGVLHVKRSKESLLGNLRRVVVAVRRALGSRVEHTLRRFVPSRFVEQGRALVRNIAHIDWTATRAYRFPMYPPAEGIVLNVRGRQQQGVVEPGSEYEQLRDWIILQARQVLDPVTRCPVIVEARRREEVYSGPHMDRAPDIILTLAEGYAAGVEAHPPVITDVDPASLARVSGEHLQHGILIAKGPMVRANALVKDARLMDIAPTILYSLGLPIPETMDGRVVSGLFQPDFLEMHHPASEAEMEAIPAVESNLSPQEEEQMKKLLERLGYL